MKQPTPIKQTMKQLIDDIADVAEPIRQYNEELQLHEVQGLQMSDADRLYRLEDIVDEVHDAIMKLIN